MRKIIFFGSMMLPENCQKSSGCPYSANRFQFELLSKLEQRKGWAINAICPFPTPSYPRSKLLYFRKKEFINGKKITVTSPFFINLGAIKIISLTFSVFIESFISIVINGKPNALLLYNPYIGYGIPALLIGKLFKIPIFGIIADLPPNNPWHQSGKARQIEAKLLRWLTKNFDALLPFSKYIINDINFQKPFLRIDPGIEIADFVNLTPLPPGIHKRNLFFAGNLCEINGLKLLLDAFSLIKDKSIELWISGRGEMETEVIESSRRDKRIHYLGFIERKNLLDHLRESGVLINPRISSLLEHKNNFPSKVIEYMAIGRPVISTSCSDISDEYSDLLFLIKNETPEDLAYLIEEVFSKDPNVLYKMGFKGRNYVIRNKNWEILADKVDGFIQDFSVILSKQ